MRWARYRGLVEMAKTVVTRSALIGIAFVGAAVATLSADGATLPIYPVDRSGTNTAVMVLTADCRTYPIRFTPDEFPMLDASDPISVIAEAVRLGVTNAYRLDEYVALFEPALQPRIGDQDYEAWREFFETATNVVFLEEYNIGTYKQVIFEIQSEIPTLSQEEIETNIRDLVAELCAGEPTGCSNEVRTTFMEAYDEARQGEGIERWLCVVKPTSGVFYVQYMKIDDQMTMVTMNMNARNLGLSARIAPSYTYAVPLPPLPDDTVTDTGAALRFNGWQGLKLIQHGMAASGPIDTLVANVVEVYRSGSTSEWLDLWTAEDAARWSAIIADTNIVSFYQSERQRFDANVFLVLTLDFGDERHAFVQVRDGNCHPVGERGGMEILSFFKERTADGYRLFRSDVLTNRPNALPPPRAREMLLEPFFQAYLTNAVAEMTRPGRADDLARRGPLGRRRSDRPGGALRFPLPTAPREPIGSHSSRSLRPMMQSSQR